jgi:hypothetical protein
MAMAEISNSSSSALSLTDKLKPLATEVEVYRRELPRLLQEGEAGRFAVIQGGRVYGTWDTYRDASQYGREKFPLDQPFMVQRIDARDVERLARFLPAEGASCSS